MTTQEKSTAIDILTLACIDGLATAMNKNMIAHGFWDDVANLPEELTPMVLSAKIALMHTELSEALEAVRKITKEKPMGPQDEHCPEFLSLEIEFADVIHRILDVAKYYGLNVGGALLAKHEYNKSRPYKHGKAL